MAVGQTTIVRLGGKIHTGDWQVRMHYRTEVSIGPKAAELEALADATEKAWTNPLTGDSALDLMSTGAELGFITLRDRVDNTIGLDRVFTTPYVGVLSGDGLPAETTLMVRKTTSAVGRRAQGRIYFPFGGESNQSSGLWDVGFVQLVLTWFVDNIDLVGPFVLNLFKLVVYSEADNIGRPVVSVSGRQLTTSQRRRMHS